MSSEDLARVLRRCRPLWENLSTCVALRSEQAFFLAFEDPESAARAKIILADHFQIADVAKDDFEAHESLIGVCQTHSTASTRDSSADPVAGVSPLLDA